MKRILGMIMVLLAAVVLMVAIACGSAATVRLPTQPPPTDTPVKGTPPLETIGVPARIEDATVEAPEEPGGEYVLNITSGLPSGCMAPRMWWWKML